MEVAIAVEETNRLRKQVGLPLIPTENGVDAPENATSAPDSEPNYKESLSVEETNRLRAKLGLAPITENPELSDTEKERDNFRAAEKEKEAQNNAAKLLSRIAQTKSELRKDARASGGTLVDQIGDDVDDDDWLANVGEPKQKKRKVERFKTVNSTAAPKETEDLTIHHDRATFDKFLGNKQEVFLTLKDKSIYDDDISEDELENAELNEAFKVQEALKEKRSKKRVETEEEFSRAAGFDVDEDEVRSGSFKLGQEGAPLEQKDRPVKPKAVLFEAPEESENEDMKSDYAKPKIKKRRKNTTNKRKVSEGERPRDLNFQYIDLINEDLENEDASDLNSFLSVTRKKTLQKKRMEAVPRGEDPKKDDVDENSDANIVVDEDEEFLKNLRPDGSDESGESQKLKEETVVTPIDKETPEPVLSKRIDNILHKDDVDESLGLSGTLKLLRERAVVAPAKDRKSGAKGGYDPQINLVYTDDDGKVLGPKEAYKYLSHKFHGHKK